MKNPIALYNSATALAANAASPSPDFVAPTNGYGMCCGTASATDTPPDGWSSSDFKNKYATVTVCNFYNGKDAKEVTVKWIPKDKDEPEDCLLAPEYKFEKFKCLPQSASRLI